VDANSELLRQFGKRLKEERLLRGHSQEHLARLAGLDRTYVSDVERGERNLGLQNIAALSAALGLEPSDLLRPGVTDIDGNDVAVIFDPNFHLDCGFVVTSRDVCVAMAQTGRVLGALPLSLFTTVDLKTQSGIVGAVFAAELALQVGAMPNPIEKGHPDVVPTSAANATEEQLRNYPEGLEIKSTLGGVTKDSGLSAGMQRIEKLEGVVWQAHHRDVRALMGLIWDFVGGSPEKLSHPSITGVFYSGTLVEDDWGAISGTTGRNTKVTGMKVSGRRKMASGAIAAIADDRFLHTYAKCLGADILADLTNQFS
jgi:hypothetical protein